MLGEVMKVLAYLYYFTWFVWPFVLIFGLAHGIKELLHNENLYNKGLIAAAIALLIILAGVVYPNFVV